MRRYLVIFCLFLSTTAAAYEQQVREVSAQLAPKLVAGNRRVVAVVDFTDLQGNTTELGRFLAEELSVALSLDAKGFSVVDRTHLKAILQENKLAATGIIDPSTARQLGKIAGVDALVTGTLTPFGDSVRLSVKVLDTGTAMMLAAATSEVPKTKAIEELLARSVGGPTTTLSDSGAGQMAPAAPISGTFHNDFIAVAVDSVGFAQPRSGNAAASLTLSVENTTSEEQFLYLQSDATITDPQARRWNMQSVSGLPRGLIEPRKQDFTRLAPGGRITVNFTFSASATDSSEPALVNLSMELSRWRGAAREPFSIGISRIPVPGGR